MKLNDTTKTVGSIIAVMLIPLAVIGWNYYSGLSSNSNSTDENLNVADISEEANADNSDSSSTASDVLGKTSNDADSNSTDKDSKSGDAIGGVKILPNTSKHPTPDE